MQKNGRITEYYNGPRLKFFGEVTYTVLDSLVVIMWVDADAGKIGINLQLWANVQRTIESICFRAAQQRKMSHVSRGKARLDVF